MLTVKILSGKKLLNEVEWRYFLAGPTGDIKVPQNPTKWIDENTWPQVFRQFYSMAQMEAFKGIDSDFMRRPDDFRHIYDSTIPHEQTLPQKWNQKLNMFQKIIVLRAIRLDKVIPAIQNWITSIMG